MKTNAEIIKCIYELVKDMNPYEAVGILEGVKFYIQIHIWEACDESTTTD